MVPARTPFVRALVVIAAVGAALALAIPTGSRQHVGDDFAVFWQAGHAFATGAPLYHDYPAGARPFKYPPFAAMVFTPLAIFPLPVAGVVFSLVNLGLWVAAVILTRDILARAFPDRTRSPLPLVLAVLLSAQFFLDNFHHVQMNGLTFVLVLVGVRAALMGREIGSAAAIVTATAIKITPIFFVAWLIVRGTRRAAMASLFLALGCVAVPLAIRGPGRGADELVEYYHGFLEGHQKGEVGDYRAGQNIAALVSRMTRPPGPGESTSPRFVPTSERTAQLVYKGSWLAILLVYFSRLVALRIRRVPISSFELAMVFLAALLLSPITFTTHLVPLLFVYAVALSVPFATIRGPAWVAALVIGVGMLASGLSGRDLVGGTIYHLVSEYSIHAWTMVWLFAAFVYLSGRAPPGHGESPLAHTPA